MDWEYQGTTTTGGIVRGESFDEKLEEIIKAEVRVQSVPFYRKS